MENAGDDPNDAEDETDQRGDAQSAHITASECSRCCGLDLAYVSHGGHDSLPLKMSPKAFWKDAVTSPA